MKFIQACARHRIGSGSVEHSTNSRIDFIRSTAPGDLNRRIDSPRSTSLNEVVLDMMRENVGGCKDWTDWSKIGGK
jgi:hypothetical protein